MALSPGTRIGSYEVTSTLGVGGMGEVYRARDSRLQRDVAIKVLPTALAHDAERLQRFEREARTLASLNHPNIAHVYGLEEVGGSTALVMELVEGPTLADRIAQGALPFAEAVPIARQIAEALEAAHELGIVHRDLKPANVKVTPDGVVKVLDFGLAKVMEQAPGSGLQAPGVTNLPTITTPAMTQAGVILGTAAYMSPEQAKGRPTDKRSDVWAFGCVLYEMLTARRAFEGEDVADTLAFVLTKEPDWSALPASVPESVRTLLKRCLARDRKARVPDASVVRFQVEDAMAAASAQPGAAARTAQSSAAPPSGRERLAWAAALLACIGAGGWFAWSQRATPTAPLPVVRFAIAPPEGGFFPGAAGMPRMAVSPDGRYVAYTVSLRDGKPNQLWVRRLDALDARPLTAFSDSDLEAAQQPLWSPDSKTIGFFRNGELLRIDLEGGSVRTLSEAKGQNYSGTWSEDGTILFGSTGSSGLQRIDGGSGGKARPVTALDTTGADPAASETAHLWPKFLADNRHFLYQIQRQGSGRTIVVGSLDGGPPVKVMDSEHMVEFAPPDVLLFPQDDALMAQRLNLTTFQLTGPPVVVSTGVQASAVNGRVAVSASRTGVLVFLDRGLSSNADTQLIWVDRTGKELGTIGAPATIRGLDLSPDGQRVAFHREDAPGTGDIWVMDVDRGTTSRLTFDPAQHSQSPVWTPDSQSVLFTKVGSAGPGIFRKVANGTGDEQPVYTPSQAGVLFATSVSADGTLVVSQSGQGRIDVALVAAGGNAAASVAGGPANEVFGQVSPDGRWIAYQSDESDSNEVYVRGVGPGGAKLQVSTNRGTRPRWRADGRELFYVRGGDGAPLMSVSVEPDGTSSLRLGRPEPLFSFPTQIFGHTPTIQSYDVSADGRRFLLGRAAPETGGTARTSEVPLTVVLNWDAVLRER